jgi:hypothetical protein
MGAMARGWESKSVEEQIESAQARGKPAAARKGAEQLGRERERASIELTRTRVMHDLAAAKHPRHREMLEAALKHLDDKLAALAEPK